MQDLGINNRFVFMGDRSKRSDIKTRLIDSFKNETLFFVKLLSRKGCTLSDETLSGKTIGRAKFSSLSPDEMFRPIKIKVSLVEVQMNLRGKKVI